jgi:3-(3-hydroxy-phenyl)propionate hydroxylase
MSKHPVVIAGGGPTGLMLAAELALAEVDVAVLERRPDQEVAGSRAGGLHSRTLEILDQRGVVDRFLAEGTTHAVARFADAALDVSDLPTRHPYTLGIWQRHVERLLSEWVAELGVDIHYGEQVVGFRQDEEGVEVELAGGGPLRAGYLVGCDGGRSLVRKAAGIEFPGWEASRSALIAEVEMTEEPELGVRHGEAGISGIGPTGEGSTLRVVLSERDLTTGEDPSLDELRAALRDSYGSDFGVHSPTWISRFTDATRQAASYREGRVLLAGDSAHVHYPAGGQGLQHGIQDAVNLGWKLAQVAHGISPDDLLDTYGTERHPVTHRSLRRTMADTALQRGDPRTDALRDLCAELGAMEEPRRHLAAQTHGLDVDYEPGGGHPLLGRRVPDLDLRTATGPIRLYSLLRGARPALIDLGGAGGLRIDAWADRVPAVEATYEGEWELPAIGVVPSPTAVLVRPDGHVAWVGEGSGEGLVEALTRWFGPPAALEAELAAVRPEPLSAQAVDRV